MADILIRDRLICVTLEGTVRESLLRENNLSLARVAGMCRAAEMSSEQMKSMVTKLK